MPGALHGLAGRSSRRHGAFFPCTALRASLSHESACRCITSLPLFPPRTAVLARPCPMFAPSALLQRFWRLSGGRPDAAQHADNRPVAPLSETACRPAGQQKEQNQKRDFCLAITALAEPQPVWRQGMRIFRALPGLRPSPHFLRRLSRSVRSCIRKRPVTDCGSATRASGVPAETIRPPFSPPPGPMSRT